MPVNDRCLAPIDSACCIPRKSKNMIGTPTNVDTMFAQHVTPMTFFQDTLFRYRFTIVVSIPITDTSNTAIHHGAAENNNTPPLACAGAAAKTQAIKKKLRNMHQNPGGRGSEGEGTNRKFSVIFRTIFVAKVSFDCTEGFIYRTTMSLRSKMLRTCISDGKPTFFSGPRIFLTIAGVSASKAFSVDCVHVFGNVSVYSGYSAKNCRQTAPRYMTYLILLENRARETQPPK